MYQLTPCFIFFIYNCFAYFFTYPVLNKWNASYLNFSKLHGLVACGGEDGALECFDMRVRSSVGRIDAVGPSGDVDQVAFILFQKAYYDA